MLKPGETVEGRDLVAVAIGRATLLIIDNSGLDFHEETLLINVTELRGGMWCVRDSWSDVIIMWRVWDGSLALRAVCFDADWEDDMVDDIPFAAANPECLDAYSDYRTLSSPAHIPRLRRAAYGRRKSGCRRRP